MKKGNFGKEDGSMLVMAIVFSFITILLGMAFLTTVARMEQIVNQDISDAKATYDGYAATMQGVMDVSRGIAPQNGHNFSYYVDDNGANNADGYSYRVIPGGTQDAGYGYSSYTRVIGTGNSSYIDETSSKDVQAELMLEGAANFLYLSDKERDVKDSIIYFWTDDTLDGPVHSNDTIHVEQGADYARFEKRVTTHRLTRPPTYISPPSNHARFDVGGRAFYGKIWKFPDQADEVRRYNGIVGPDGRYLGSTDPATMTQIALSHDTLFVRHCFFDPDSLPRDTVWQCSPSQIGSGDVYLIPTTGCVFVMGKVLLSATKRFGLHPHADTTDGAFPFKPPSATNLKTFLSAGLDGKLTIGTSDTLIIGDDLVYTHCKSNFSVPASIDSCDDFLGLISENFIMFGKSANRTIHVNAAMAAIHGSITVQDIYDYYHTNWKQSLFIYGSLAQRNRGKVHTGEIGNERGFREKDYHYDWRFATETPPHYLPPHKSTLNFIDTSNNHIVGGNI